MGQSITKYISASVSQEILNSITSKLETLKKSTKNFSKLINHGKISLSSDNIMEFYDFLHSYSEVHSFVDSSKFIHEIENTSTETELLFWNAIISYFDFANTVLSQTCFLREMNFENFCDIVKYTFENYILCDNLISKDKTWNKDEIMITRKTIGTFLTNMTEKFYNFETTIYDLDMMFHFSTEKYQFIWELCERNKIYLMLKNITEKLNAK